MQKLKIFNCEQKSKEWFDIRSTIVTASLAGAVMGVNPYETITNAMNRKLGIIEFNGSPDIDRGNLMEDSIAFDYELETGHATKECGIYVYKEWLGASPDRLVGDDGLLEIKCPRKVNKEVPKHYYAQMQCQLYVTGREWCDYYAKDNNGAFFLERVHSDKEYQQELIDKMRSFYDEWHGVVHLDSMIIVDDYVKLKKDHALQTKYLSELKEEILNKVGHKRVVVGNVHIYQQERSKSWVIK